MGGGQPQLSDDPTEQEAAMRLLGNLQDIRERDPASFDQMLGGQTQAPGLVRAFVDHANGRRYERGLKPEGELTALERYSMRLPLHPQ